MVKIISHDFGQLETLYPAKHDLTEVGFNKYQNPPHYNILKQIDIKNGATAFIYQLLFPKKINEYSGLFDLTAF